MHGHHYNDRSNDINKHEYLYESAHDLITDVDLAHDFSVDDDRNNLDDDTKYLAAVRAVFDAAAAVLADDTTDAATSHRGTPDNDLVAVLSADVEHERFMRTVNDVPEQRERYDRALDALVAALRSSPGDRPAG